jgi:threonine dehydrogenase-like Zn-dependent dehydrogenase
MAAACARMIGIRRIWMIDHHADRLAYAEQAYGVVPVDFSRIDDPAELIIDATDYRGVDASIDAVGFEAKGSTLESTLTALGLEGSRGASVRLAIAARRRGGTISIAGVYAGQLHGFMLGDAFEKGLNFRMGQTHVQKYMPELLGLIQRGELAPEQIITHRLPLADAAAGYAAFDLKQDGCRKVVLFN